MFIKVDNNLADKSPIFNLAPQQIKTVKMVFKTTETEEGFLFGYMSYSSASGNVPHIIPFNHIQLSSLDVIIPQKISPRFFKMIWMDFIWENSFSNHVAEGLPYDIVVSVSKKYNLCIITPLTQFDKTASVLVANLCGKTKFGIIKVIYL